MPTLKAKLQSKLKDCRHLVVLGVGSELRGDDIAGLLVAEHLSKKPQPKITTIQGGTAPENFTGEIKKLAPSHLLIVDSAEMGRPVGEVRLIEPQEVGGYSFSTHSLPLKVMIDFILAEYKCEVLIIGIQPKNLAFGLPVSPEVEVAAKAIAADIYQIMLL